MAIYMQYDGGKIKGAGGQGNHQDWIVIKSIQWGVGRSVSTDVGIKKEDGTREASEPSISEVVITKEFDKSSVLLSQESTTNNKGKDVKIDFCSTANEGAPYLQIILSNCLISGYSVTSGGDRPSESISLNFLKIEYNEAGTQAPNKSSYDLQKAKSS